VFSWAVIETSGLPVLSGWFRQRPKNGLLNQRDPIRTVSLLVE